VKSLVFKTLFLVMLGLSIQMAYAEGPCPQGEIDIDQRCGGGVCQPVCAPIQNYNNNYAPPPPPIRWIEQCGAIALGVTQNNSKILGTSANMISETVATTFAMNDCNAKGGGDTCVITRTYCNQCIALAAPPGRETGLTGVDTDISKAKQDSIEQCNQAGIKNCHVIYSACSMPVQVQ